MRDRDKKEYLDGYREAKQSGIPFWPDALFKDAVVALGIFFVLIVLSLVLGAALGDRVDPSVEFDPEPEWYFLFLFQLLKYFPGSLEFLGVVVLPGIAVLGLLALPWLDRSSRRHFSGRPVVISITALFAIGAVGLTILALVERPPPSGGEAAGDPVARLYAENCSACHGGIPTVSEDTDLVEIIAAGSHESMPAWSGDLSGDEIDALAGFIASPRGNEVFSRTCAACHESMALVESGPSDVRSALEDGNEFAPHVTVELPPSIGELRPQDGTALLNFLSAPVGQRLFAENCSSCHGSAVAFGGTAEELRAVIESGGRHLEMPAMGGVLTEGEISLLSEYVVSPGDGSSEARGLFAQACEECHGSRVPTAASVEEARTIIVTGGAHEVMPVWGEILTTEQVVALTDYTLATTQDSPVRAGQAIFADQCAACHGDFGEGGVNPANPSLVIAPISTASYLQTRDDVTIRAVISRGQPDLGMSPFALSFGGSLDEEDIQALVAFIRAWEADPPVELPPEFERAPLLGSGPEIFGAFCSQCHGLSGEGGIGPSFQDPAYHAGISDLEMFTAIDQGHEATPMISWGAVLTDDQILSLVGHLRLLEVSSGSSAVDVSFARDILPIFDASCAVCHGSFGGWTSDTYHSVMTTGNSAPVVIPGDPERSLLVQLMEDPGARLMPPGGALSGLKIRLITDWIESGAPDN